MLLEIKMDLCVYAFRLIFGSTNFLFSQAKVEI